MKLILTAIIASMFLACSPQSNSIPGDSIDMLDHNGNSKPQEGGVDVGPKKGNPRFFVYKVFNNSLVPVPGTQLFVSVSFGWKQTELADGLEINHHDGSKITITKANMGMDVIPTPELLKSYLNVKHPGRNYTDVEINGSIGIRAEFTNTDGRTETDIYLVSELNDFVHVVMNLQHKDTVLVNGQNVLASIQIKREGKAVPLSMTKQVTLKSTVASSEVPLEFAKTSSTSLKLSESKKATGYIVEVNATDNALTFESIKPADQAVLFGENKSVAVEDLFKTFGANNQTASRKTIELRVGGIYLVRTENGLFDDLVTKILVEELVPGKSVTLKYQTLLTVSVGILIQQPKPLKD